METDAAKDEPPKKTRKVKKQVRKGDLPIVSGTNSLDSTILEAFVEKEAQMASEDKLVADTEEKKNELETFIYELRNKLDDQYADFASDEEKTKIRAKLDAAEVNCNPLPSSSYTPVSPFSQPVILLSLRFPYRLTLLCYRTGYMTRVMILPRVFTLPRSTKSVPWQAQ